MKVITPGILFYDRGALAVAGWIVDMGKPTVFDNPQANAELTIEVLIFIAQSKFGVTLVREAASAESVEHAESPSLDAERIARDVLAKASRSQP